MDHLHIGVLYPGHAAEDDYLRIQTLLHDVRITVTHTSVGEDAHRVDALLDLGSDERLAAGARQLLERDVEVVTWACTSGSFVFGWRGAHRQVEALRSLTGVPASSTSLAYLAALAAMGVRTVGIAASYPAEVTERFVALLADAGVEAVRVGSHDIVTAAEVGALEPDAVHRLAKAGDHPDAEAVLVPDTAMRTVEQLDALEATLGKPVLTANQVTVWDALRLAGALRATDGLGRLFRTP